MRFDTSSECCYSERLVRINGPFPRSPAYGFLVTDNPFIRRRLGGNQPFARTTDSADDHLGTVASHRIGGQCYSTCRYFNLVLVIASPKAFSGASIHRQLNRNYINNHWG